MNSFFHMTASDLALSSSMSLAKLEIQFYQSSARLNGNRKCK